jgi:hypothetical protein
MHVSIALHKADFGMLGIGEVAEVLPAMVSQ